MKKKKYMLCTLILLLVTFTGCAQSSKNEKKLPELHIINYDKSMPWTSDELGADAFNHMTDHADSKYYVINDFYNQKSNDTLHIISHFKTYQQTTEYTCGAASALMVLNYFGNADYNEQQLSEMANTHEENGTYVQGLVSTFEKIGFTVEFHADTNPYFDSITDFEAYLIEKLDQKIPMIVDWVDWRGHWQVIIGVDTCGTENPYDDVLIMADPYDVTDHYQDGYYTVPFGRFYDMWREGICANREIAYEQPFVVAYPKMP